MAKFKKGDIVICKKFTVGQKIVFATDGISTENCIDDCYFNREAVIEYTHKECMLKCGVKEPEDKGEYGIRFLDNGELLAWLTDDELILKTPHRFAVVQI